jgi:hypothetical protein
MRFVLVEAVVGVQHHQEAVVVAELVATLRLGLLLL